MTIPAEDCDAVDNDSATFLPAGHLPTSTQHELDRHVQAGTFPTDFDDTARLLLAALEIESPSSAIVEWMSRTSMELTRHVQHRRAN